MSGQHESLTLSPPSMLALTRTITPLDEGRMTLNATGGDVNKYVSDDVAFYVIVVVQIFLCGVISIVGIGTNIIIILVFIKQGVFTESSTVSLMALAVSELLSTSTMLWLSTSYSVALADPPDLTWNAYDVMYLTAGWPHTIVGLVSRMLTAFVSFERCFCVVFPFKVKSVFTSKCSFVSVVSIFAYFLLSYSPVFIFNSLQNVLDPVTNATRLSLKQAPEWKLADGVLASVNLFVLNFGSVAIVLVCTVVTVSRVKLSMVWRENNASSNSSGNGSRGQIKNVVGASGTSAGEKDSYDCTATTTTTNAKSLTTTSTSSTKLQKEKKLVKMISSISVIFLVCYSPNVFLPVLYILDNEITVDGYQSNLSWVAFSLCFLTESINSCVNLGVYYRMSSKFRKEFRLLFGMDGK